MNGFEAGAGLLADCCEDFRLGMKPFSEFVALFISPCLDGECPLRCAERCCCHCDIFVVKAHIARPSGRFRIPDTAQLCCFLKCVDTKTADMGRQHLYRDMYFDVAKKIIIPETCKGCRGIIL